MTIIHYLEGAIAQHHCTETKNNISNIRERKMKSWRRQNILSSESHKCQQENCHCCLWELTCNLAHGTHVINYFLMCFVQRGPVMSKLQHKLPYLLKFTDLAICYRIWQQHFAVRPTTKVVGICFQNWCVQPQLPGFGNHQFHWPGNSVISPWFGMTEDPLSFAIICSCQISWVC